MADYAKIHDDWRNKTQDLSTPVTAENMEHIEEGIFNAQRAADLAQAAADVKATLADITAHNNQSVAVHGIPDTASLETIAGAIAKVAAALAAAATDATNKANAAKARGVHTGTQPITTVTETATGKILTDVERTKLGTVNAGATVGIVPVEHNIATGFPVRPTTLVAPVVQWINRHNTDLPTVGGTGAIDGVDIALIVSA